MAIRMPSGYCLIEQSGEGGSNDNAGGKKKTHFEPIPWAYGSTSPKRPQTSRWLSSSSLTRSVNLKSAVKAERVHHGTVQVILIWITRRLFLLSWLMSGKVSIVRGYVVIVVISQ